MASRKIEDIHTTLLNKLLDDSGLMCFRTAPESSESSSESEHMEEQGEQEGEEELAPEIVLEEEKKLPFEEEMREEMPEIFPTPSLRRVLPDKIRKIEEYNRIHVLPEEFMADIDPHAIPKIAHTAQQKYIDTLAGIVGCKRYKSSLPEYWFLDTLANLLRRAQEDELDRPTQAVLIIWFCEWMKEMQHFDAANRERMLRRFQITTEKAKVSTCEASTKSIKRTFNWIKASFTKDRRSADNMLAAARFIAEENHLPVPSEVGVHYKAAEEIPEISTSVPGTDVPKHLVTFEGAAYECSLRDLTKIIHYIYDLFSTDYQYNLVRSIFTFSSEYMLINTPYQIQTPKRLFAPPKNKPKKEKSPKKEIKGKSKKKEVETKEFLALMELKAKEEKELEEIEDRDREAWHRRVHILPLGYATTDEFFNKYWPPPPPEPEPEPEPEVKVKGKGKGKK